MAPWSDLERSLAPPLLRRLAELSPADLAGHPLWARWECDEQPEGWEADDAFRPWTGAPPDRALVRDYYVRLGVRAGATFPIRFSAAPGLSLGITTGEIPGFCSIPDLYKVAITR